ncbi:hypothetical protein [Pelagibacterium sediminicola]|uniref:hypothetical protein n=1 Tax=Pelagibacterium sediminicola TaxID=2248761 RepID=UPI000E320BA8|nr:hypothetical protein [Pelagibacterium sediminicola]
MNVANLQLQGLYLAVAAINNALAAKGLLTREDINDALAHAEQVALGDDRILEDLHPSNRDAVAFPMRFLALANRRSAHNALPGFSELARLVGETKEPYNDQA